MIGVLRMNNYILSCCSVVDLTPEHLAKRNIPFISLHYHMNGKDHLDDMGQTVSSEDFYMSMKEGATATTSQINVDEYTQYFEQFLSAGKDIIHLALSSGLSGSYNSARIASEILSEKYPERTIYVIDSLAASSGDGLFIDAMADQRDAGATIHEVYAWAEEHKLNLHHWFTASDLTWFAKGGRITKVAGWFGTVLKICPVMNVDYLGRLIPRFKIRGKQNALKELVNQMKEHAQNGTDYSGKCYISHSFCGEDAEYVANEVRKYFPNIDGEIGIYNIGSTIGCHSGPGTVALFFWGDKREN